MPIKVSIHTAQSTRGVQDAVTNMQTPVDTNSQFNGFLSYPLSLGVLEASKEDLKLDLLQYRENHAKIRS